MLRIVVTGSGGFLGNNVIRALCDEYWVDEIAALTSKRDLLEKQFAAEKKLRIFESNAFKNNSLELQTYDIILNCAFPRAVSSSEVADGLEYVESVFIAGEEAKVRGIVNISSQSLYDPQRTYPAAENDRLVLLDSYALGKYCMELLLRNICKSVPYTSIRLASLIGPGFDVRVPNKMIKNALEKGTITVQESSKRFGYLDVADAVRGLIGVLRMEPNEWKPIYNLGSNNTYSVAEIAECIAENVGEITGQKIQIHKTKGDGTLNSSLDNTLLISDIGNYCRLDLDSSVKRIIHHMTKE